MFEPIKIGLGGYLEAFYDSIVPTTKALTEFTQRGYAKSFAWAPSRMVDEAENMLASWQRNDTDSTDTQPSKLPVVIVAVAQDYTPTGRDFTRQVANSEWGILPNDVKERVFGIRTIASDIRAQLVIFAAEEPTGHSIAKQFCLFLDAMPNRRFHAKYIFAGLEQEWPVQIESPDMPAMRIQSEAKNLVILAVDLTLKATIPLFDAPEDDEPNDGKGTPGTEDPAGYPVVIQVDFDNVALDIQTTVTTDD